MLRGSGPWYRGRGLRTFNHSHREDEQPNEVVNKRDHVVPMVSASAPPPRWGRREHTSPRKARGGANNAPSRAQESSRENKPNRGMGRVSDHGGNPHSSWRQPGSSHPHPPISGPSHLYRYPPPLPASNHQMNASRPLNFEQPPSSTLQAKQELLSPLTIPISLPTTQNPPSAATASAAHSSTAEQGASIPTPLLPSPALTQASLSPPTLSYPVSVTPPQNVQPLPVAPPRVTQTSSISNGPQQREGATGAPGAPPSIETRSPPKRSEIVHDVQSQTSATASKEETSLKRAHPPPSQTASGSALKRRKLTERVQALASKTIPRDETNLDTKYSAESPNIPIMPSRDGLVKPEPRSPSLSLLDLPPTRRLVTEFCSLYELPQSCRKTHSRHIQNRQEFYKKELSTLKRLGFNIVKGFFRDDGMVIEWTSRVPVWSDTLLPEKKPQDTTVIDVDDDIIILDGPPSKQNIKPPANTTRKPGTSQVQTSSATSASTSSKKRRLPESDHDDDVIILEKPLLPRTSTLKSQTKAAPSPLVPQNQLPSGLPPRPDPIPEPHLPSSNATCSIDGPKPVSQFPPVPPFPLPTQPLDSRRSPSASETMKADAATRPNSSRLSSSASTLDGHSIIKPTSSPKFSLYVPPRQSLWPVSVWPESTSGSEIEMDTSPGPSSNASAMHTMHNPSSSGAEASRPPRSLRSSPQVAPTAVSKPPAKTVPAPPHPRATTSEPSRVILDQPPPGPVESMNFNDLTLDQHIAPPIIPPQPAPATQSFVPPLQPPADLPSVGHDTSMQELTPPVITSTPVNPAIARFEAFNMTPQVSSPLTALSATVSPSVPSMSSSPAVPLSNALSTRTRGPPLPKRKRLMTSSSTVDLLSPTQKYDSSPEAPLQQAKKSALPKRASLRFSPPLLTISIPPSRTPSEDKSSTPKDVRLTLLPAVHPSKDLDNDKPAKPLLPKRSRIPTNPSSALPVQTGDIELPRPSAFPMSATSTTGSGSWEEEELLAKGFLQRFMSAFVSDRPSIMHAYTSDAVLSCRVFPPPFILPGQPGFGKFYIPNFSMSQKASRPLMATELLTRLGPYMLSQPVKYDMVVLGEAVGGGILLTASGNVIRPASASLFCPRIQGPSGDTKDQQQMDGTPFYMSHSFVLRRAVKGVNTVDPEAWPFLVSAHQIVIRYVM